MDFAQENQDPAVPYSWFVIFTHKLAELIAEECAHICENGMYDTKAEDWDTSYWDQACLNRSQAIKNYFSI